MMDPFRVMSVMVQLSDAIVQYPALLSWRQLIQQERHQPHQPLSPATQDLKNSLVRVDKLWPRIEWVVELSRRGEAILKEGLTRLSSIEDSLSGIEYSKRAEKILKPILSGDIE